MRIALKILGVLLFLVVVSAQPSHKPPYQIVASEICVNYICYQGTVTIAVIDDTVMHISRRGNTRSIPVKKIVIIKGRYFFHFDMGRGFLSLGRQDRTAFMFLDKDNVTLRVEHSTISQQ